MLGNARLNYDQLRTCLSSLENVVNERPLTVVTEDQNDLVPLTSAMFLRGIGVASFPECMAVDATEGKPFNVNCGRGFAVNICHFLIAEKCSSGPLQKLLS